jgi:hypothetical protein
VIDLANVGSVAQTRNLAIDVCVSLTRPDYREASGPDGFRQIVPCIRDFGPSGVATTSVGGHWVGKTGFRNS